MISERTKAALAGAKARGVKLGNQAQADRNRASSQQRAPSACSRCFAELRRLFGSPARSPPSSTLARSPRRPAGRGRRRP